MTLKLEKNVHFEYFKDLARDLVIRVCIKHTVREMTGTCASAKNTSLTSFQENLPLTPIELRTYYYI